MKITILSLVFLATTINLSCKDGKIPENHDLAVITNTDVESHKLNSLDITLKKDKVYEIAYANIYPEKQEVLFKQYFPKAGPLVAKYGGKNLASFGVTDIKKGGIIEKPTMLVIYEWPSLEVFEKAMADTELKKLFPLRDSTFKDFGQTFVTTPQDTPISFKANKSYEFFMAWLKPNSQQSLREYFKVSNPIKKTYGKPEPIFRANLSPVANQPGIPAILKPQMVGIVEWDNVNDPDVLTSNADFISKAQPLFENAIQRIEMIHGKVIIQ